MIAQCECGDKDAAWHPDISSRAVAPADGWPSEGVARIHCCARCWLSRMARTERHPNVFISGGLRCVNGGPRKCPYRDLRKTGGRITFSRYWRNLWFSGWDAARAAGYGKADISG